MSTTHIPKGPIQGVAFATGNRQREAAAEAATEHPVAPAAWDNCKPGDQPTAPLPPPPPPPASAKTMPIRLWAWAQRLRLHSPLGDGTELATLLEEVADVWGTLTTAIPKPAPAPPAPSPNDLWVNYEKVRDGCLRTYLHLELAEARRLYDSPFVVAFLCHPLLAPRDSLHAHVGGADFVVKVVSR